MIFVEAKEALKIMACGRYCSLDIQVNLFPDGREQFRSRCYIDGFGYAESGNDHAAALYNMRAMMQQQHDPNIVLGMLPTEESPFAEGQSTQQ